MNENRQEGDSAGSQGAAEKPGKKKKDKRPFLQGTRDRVVTGISLGRTLIEEPRSFPGRLQQHLLAWARATWNARGGGFYACGFVVTFAWLELKLLFTELFTSGGPGDFVLQQVLQLVLRFTVDSLLNTLLALIWPALILSFSPLFGAAGLAIGYLVFARYLKEPITRTLFGDCGDRF